MNSKFILRYTKIRTKIVIVRGTVCQANETWRVFEDLEMALAAFEGKHLEEHMLQYRRMHSA
jgi:hypothetical protein